VAVAKLLSEFADDPAALVAGLTSPSGDVFLEWVVAYLRRALGVAYAFVGELWGEDWDRVRSLALVTSDGLQENFEYDLLETPCVNVLAQQTCSYPRDVAEQFPRDPLLREMGAESYVGTPLIDRSGRPLGLLVVLHTEPMGEREADLASSSLELFRPRVESELERRRTLRELRVVVEGATQLSSEDSLQALAKALAHAMHVKHAFISEIVSLETGIARTLAVSGDGEILPNLTYDLAGSPCENVFRDGVVFHPAGVRDLYPEDALTNRVKADAYLAVAFSDSHGNALGHLGLLHDRPLNHQLHTQPLFQVFASSTRSELERRRVERERLEIERKLFDSQRMESLGLLAGGVAHDFNNLLVSILGNAELARSDLARDVSVGTHLLEIETAAKRATDLCRRST
jgi:hypothetical protein